jgi:NAD(P)-dependent dehydrogenase (short-subunit alcohol dehydrogenase family)
LPRALVTGANRGLGLELVRQYSAEGWDVLACCREPLAAEELSRLAEEAEGIEPCALDVTDLRAVDGLAQRLAGRPIDVLLNNAGLYSVTPGRRDDTGQSFGDMDYAAWERVLRVNTMAPLKLAEAFADHVAASQRKTIAIVTSGMGSIERSPGGFYAYRSSKAAVNMVAASLARDLEPRGIRVALLSPGWVRTRMGGASAKLSPEESVRGLRERIAEIDTARSGRFLSWDGSELPW